MPKALIMLVIGLFFGTGLGFVLSAGTGAEISGHDHGAHDAGDPAAHDHAGHGGEAHDHSALYDSPAGVPAPTLTATLASDPVSGWNLHLMTTGFTFAPREAGAEASPGEGHAHVYAAGIKLARIYGPWFHIDHLPDGADSVTVTLNANDHRQYAVEGNPLSVTVPLPAQDD